MVKILKNLLETYNSWQNHNRCKRAIKLAKKLAVTTGKKQLVIMYGGKPIVISKQGIKRQIKAGFFCKGFTPEKTESLAIFKTQ